VNFLATSIRPKKESPMKSISPLAFAILTLSSSCLQAATYKLETRYPVGGSGGWDYITVDSAARRLYVSHGTQVNVLDADSGKPIGVIENTLGVHGIAIASDGQHGFTSNGKEDTVSMFDTKTLALIKKIEVGKGPDSIYFEPVSQRVFTSNHGSHDMTAIDASNGKVVGTIEAKGDGEGIVSTSDGLLFVNQEDTSEVVEIDAKTLKVKHRYTIDGGKTPTGLAFDRNHNRLFIACRSKVLVVMNAQDGKTVGTVPIGAGTDAAGFDAEAGLIFVSNGEQSHRSHNRTTPIEMRRTESMSPCVLRYGGPVS
jgi:YVTN family beta-propeller protein